MSLLRISIVALLTTILVGANALAQTSRAPVPVPNAATSSDEEPAEDAAEEVTPDEEPEPPPRVRPAPRIQQRVQQDRPRPQLDQPRRAMPGMQKSDTPRPAASRPGPAPARQPQPVRPVPAVAASADGTIPALENLTAMRERPLFSTTRRPPEPEDEPEAAEPIVEGGSMPFELVGVVIGEDISAAIFRNTDSKEETRVAKGEKIANWNLEEVTARAVVLRGRDKRVRMRLFDEASAPGIQVGRVSGDSEETEATPGADDEEVDEDIAPSSSPQAKPATAQPKPPPSVRKDQQERRRNSRPNRRNQREFGNRRAD